MKRVVRCATFDMDAIRCAQATTRGEIDAHCEHRRGKCRTVGWWKSHSAPTASEEPKGEQSKPLRHRAARTTSLMGDVTHIITTIISPEGAVKQHEGSFGNNLHSATNSLSPPQLYAAIDLFAARSAVLCTPSVALHVLHNLDSGLVVRFRKGVTYHADPRELRRTQTPMMPTIDLRFWLLLRLLKQQPRWSCVFAVDVSDVDVLVVPRCGHHVAQSALAMASDGCHGDFLRRWLLRKGLAAGFNATWNVGFEAWLRGVQPIPDWCVVNCGIFGGTRPIVLKALQWIVDRLGQVWSGAGRVRLMANQIHDPVGDMVAFNEWAFEHRTMITMGYPHGPVNLPMYGHLELGRGRNVTGGWCNAREDTCFATADGWFEASRGRYWFGHKLPGHRRWQHLPPTCRWANDSHVAVQRRTNRHRAIPQCTLDQCKQDLPVEPEDNNSTGVAATRTGAGATLTTYGRLPL
jgi:hypothetical protein